MSGTGVKYTLSDIQSLNQHLINSLTTSAVLFLQRVESSRLNMQRKLSRLQGKYQRYNSISLF